LAKRANLVEVEEDVQGKQALRELDRVFLYQHAPKLMP